MPWIKRSSKINTLAGLLALGLVMNTSALVLAESFPPSLSSKLPAQWEFGDNLPGNPGTPDGREGGASRGPDDCIKRGKDENKEGKNENKEKLIALVPASGVGATVAKYPTFYWYLPPNNARAVDFFLWEGDQQVYSTRLAIAPDQSGFMSLQLPAFPALLPLKAGHQYKWNLGLICNPSDPSANIYITNDMVLRVEKSPNLPGRSDNLPLQAQLALYAKSHLWYETLNTLAELRRLNPKDAAVADAWTKLLRSVDLEKIAQEPMVVQSTSTQLDGVPEQQTNNVTKGRQAK